MHTRNVLTKRIRIVGPDFWGHNAEVLLEPADKPGWYIETNGEDTPINSRMIAYRWRRLVLDHPARLHTIEHLLALRWMVDAVRIVPITTWLPYSGDASIFWNRVKENMVPAGVLEPCWAKDHLCQVDTRNAARAVSLNRICEETSSFTIRIYVKYGELPELEPYVLKFPCSRETFDEIATAKTPAWPPARSRMLWKMGRVIRMGPTGDMIAWLDESDPIKSLQTWQRHRALDALGALAAALPPRRIFVGQFFSHRAGHQLDVELLRAIESVGIEDEAQTSGRLVHTEHM